MTRNEIPGGTAAAIAASVEQASHAGRAAPGEPLPTVRDLAATLRVSPATVAAAYKLLRARGLIAGQGRRGTRVAARPPRASRASRGPARSGRDRRSRHRQPGSRPAAAARARAARDRRPSLRLYGERAGSRARSSRSPPREFEADGIPARCDRRCVSGALDAIERVLREHLRPGDRVAVEDPVVPGVVDLVAASRIHRRCRSRSTMRARAGRVATRRCARGVPRGDRDAARAEPDRRGAHRRARGDAADGCCGGYPDVAADRERLRRPRRRGAAGHACGRARERWAVVRSTSKFLGPDLRVALMAGDDADDCAASRDGRRSARGG